MILGCDCRSPYQDKKHGPGQRVHNPKADDTYRCTICSRVRSK